MWLMLLFVTLSHASVCSNECNVTLTFPVACPAQSETVAVGSVSIEQCIQSTPDANIGLIVGGVVVGVGVVGFAFWFAISSYVKPTFPLAGVKINP